MGSIANVDVIEVIGVWSQYSRYVDGLDYDGLHELFTPDVVWNTSAFGGASGREAVLELIRGGQGAAAGGDMTKRRPWVHVMTNPWVSVDGEAAVGKFYMSAYFLEGRERKPNLAGLGDYKVDFVREADRWLIKSVFLDFFTVSDL